MRTLWISLVIVGSATLSLPGCAHNRAELLEPGWTPHANHVIFAVDGAGNFQKSSASLRQTAEADGLPLDVVTYEWSHGYLRVIADQTHYAYAQEQGAKLACKIMEFRQCYPCAKIYLWAHSAGAAVALVALENTAPGTVEGMVLLAPSVSAYYDIRPALCRVGCHIDVFTSRRDFWYLGLGTRIIGTSENSHRIAAGRFGFKTKIQCPEDECLYQKLRQHPWQWSDRSLGHSGDHYGGYQPNFLRAKVLPLFFEVCCPTPTPQ